MPRREAACAYRALSYTIARDGEFMLDAEGRFMSHAAARVRALEAAIELRLLPGASSRMNQASLMRCQSGRFT